MMLYRDPFPPRTANTQVQAGDNGTVDACPQKQKTQLESQVQVNSGRLDCHARHQGVILRAA